MFNFQSCFDKLFNRSKTIQVDKTEKHDKTENCEETDKIDKTEALINSSVRVILNQQKNELLDESTLNTLKQYFSDEEKQKYAFVAFCFGRYVSDNLFDSLHFLVKSGYRVLIYADDNDCSSFIRTKINQLKKYKSCLVLQVSENHSFVDLLRRAAECLQSEYVVSFTFMDKINFRSFVQRLDDVINQNTNSDIFISSEYYSSEPEDYNTGNCRQDWSLSGISGVIFRSVFLIKALSTLDTDRNLFLLERIISSASDTGISIFNDSYLFNKILTHEISLNDISVAAKETVLEIEKSGFDGDKAEKILRNYNVIVRDLFNCTDAAVLKKALIFASTGYVLFYCEQHKLDVEKWKELLSKSLDFCHKLTYRDVYDMICRILPVLIAENQSDVFVIENTGMRDIRNSRFFNLLSEKYSVDYQVKKAYVDYYPLNNLIIKMHSRSARLTLSSAGLNKSMYYYSDRHITLWHGLGWLKKTVFYPQNNSVGTIVCSSKACEDGYKEHFHADRAIGLGCVQTDKLFDKSFLGTSREKIHQKYNIPEDNKIIFLAPTFRIGEKGHYYNFGMNIDELAQRLKEHNLYLITKRHHVFIEALRSTGKDSSGVYNSQNGRFIIDESCDITELMAACDCFVTDYSSSMYYAFVLNRPIFLYATDIEAYKNGPNGFEINYPDDIPLPLVDKPNIDDFISGYYRSLNVPNTPAYQEYRKYNVNDCDGRVDEKVMEYLATLL